MKLFTSLREWWRSLHVAMHGPWVASATVMLIGVWYIMGLLHHGLIATAALLMAGLVTFISPIIWIVEERREALPLLAMGILLGALSLINLVAGIGSVRENIPILVANGILLMWMDLGFLKRWQRTRETDTEALRGGAGPTSEN